METPSSFADVNRDADRKAMVDIALTPLRLARCRFQQRWRQGSGFALLGEDESTFERMIAINFKVFNSLRNEIAAMLKTYGDHR